MVEKNIIPVVFGVDSNYLLPAFVVMRSILENSVSDYKFIVISADDIKENTNTLYMVLKREYNNFEMQVIDIAPDIFKECDIHNSHLSLAAYNRLLIPKLVEGYEKCIYLDSDVLVNGDLQELYDIDLGEAYVAGVKDCHILMSHNDYHKDLLGVDTLNGYINSGVMILNLKKLQEEDFTTKFIEASKLESLYEDQDAINRCCYGNMMHLPLKYNLFHFYMGKSIKRLFELPYEQSDFAFDWNKPFILHMGGIYKPWNGYMFKGSREWWRLARLYSETREYRCYEDNINNPQVFVFELNKIIKRCKKAKKVVIWGYTGYGRQLYHTLQRNGVDNIIAFGDNNLKFRGKYYDGIYVKSLEEFDAMDHNIIWLIACRKAYKQVMQQLVSRGIEFENIICGAVYNQKEKMYYLALSSKNYKEELENIALCEGRSLEDIEKIITNSQNESKEYDDFKRKYYAELWICMQ